MPSRRLNIMPSRELTEAASANLLVHAGWVQRHTPGMRVHTLPGVVAADSGLPCDTFNQVFNARLTPDSAADRIRDVIELYNQVSRPFSWWLSPGDAPENLGALLTAAGLTADESELAMAADLGALKPGDPSPGGLQIRRVTTDEALADFARIVAANWSPPDANVIRFYERAAPVVLQPNCPLWLYVGYFDGVPVACSEGTVAGEVVGLYNVCTLVDYRRRGFGGALTMQPLLDARARGCHVAVLQASDEGARVYRRLGFEPFGDIIEYKPIG